MTSFNPLQPVIRKNSEMKVRYHIIALPRGGGLQDKQVNIT